MKIAGALVRWCTTERKDEIEYAYQTNIGNALQRGHIGHGVRGLRRHKI